MNLLDKTGLEYFWGKLKANFATKAELNAKQDALMIDNALSPTSENPVQNKVIYSAIGDIETLLAAI